MSEQIHKRNVREALAPRREPYWGPPMKLKEGVLYIGYRAIDKGRGSWIARTRDAATGKQRYSALRDAHDHEAATAKAVEWMKALDAGVEHTGPYTVESACKEYVEDRRREKGDGPAANADWCFQRSIYDTDLARIECDKLRTPAIKKWRDALTTTDDQGRKMGKSSANRTMTVLRAALNLAVRNRRISAARTQEWAEVKQYKKADGRREIFLDLAQRRALIEAAQGSVGDLIQGALLTGARPGELVAAKRGDFDARTKTIKLSGKTGARHVPLIGMALALFERLAKSKLPAARLFLRDDGEPWTKMAWSRAIRTAVDAAVVKDDKGEPVLDEDGEPVKLPAGVCLYVARHTYISQAILDGLNPLDVSKLTGTSLQMINEHYGHLVQAGVRERIGKVQML